jgi:transcriptional regulator with XRE-family HTH domain
MITRSQKKEIKRLLEKNLAHAGFVKQPYAQFRDHFLDSIVCQNENYCRWLRKLANLSKQEMADLAGVSVHSIRRYESDWESSKVPKWYYILLRLVNGDLSFFGPRWHDTRIFHHDRKLRTKFSIKAMEPAEMNANYNRHFLDARREARAEQAKAKELQIKLEAMERELALSRLRIESLTDKISELEAKKLLTEKGKLIPLFSNDR